MLLGEKGGLGVVDGEEAVDGLSSQGVAGDNGADQMNVNCVSRSIVLLPHIRITKSRLNNISDAWIDPEHTG